MTDAVIVALIYVAFLGGLYLAVTRPLWKRINRLALGLDRIEDQLSKIEGRRASAEKKVEVIEIKTRR
jgi:hypothetical protein